MQTKKVIYTQDFRRLMFSDIYNKYSDPKNRRRAFMLVEGGINCFDKKGFENVNLTMIARESGVTRQSLKHYFTDLAEFRELAIKYIRVVGQQLMLQHIGSEKKPDKILQGYIESHWLWASNFKNHVRVWLSFLSYCSKNVTDRSLNTLATVTGHTRIQECLEQGRISGVFHHLDDKTATIVIQTLITGSLVRLLTENLEYHNEFPQIITQQCFETVKLVTPY